MYFAPTMIDEDNAKPLRSLLNEIASSLYQPYITSYKPLPSSAQTPLPQQQQRRQRVLVVVSRSRWQYDHVIYRGHGAHVASLLHDADHRYEVSLLILHTYGTADHITPIATQGAPSPNDIPFAHEFHHIEHGTLDGALLANDTRRITSFIVQQSYDIIYYIGIGVITGDVILANKRLAPIQICDYAHPFSTYGAQIDYMMGSHIEWLPDDISQSFNEHTGLSLLHHPHYTETLVMMPYYGVIHTPLPHRTYPLRSLWHTDSNANTNANDNDNGDPYANNFIIYCGWNVYKLQPAHITLLRQLGSAIVAAKLDASKITIRLVTAVVSSLPYTRRLFERLIGGLPYHVAYESGVSDVRYQELIATSHMYLDSYPYGGMSTLVDAISHRLPFVVRRGHRWHNRIGAAMATSLGLSSYVFDDDHTMIQYIVTLIAPLISSSTASSSSSSSSSASLLYNDMIQQMNAIALPSSLYNRGDDAIHFANSLHYIAMHHHQLQHDGIGMIRINSTTSPSSSSSSQQPVTNTRTGHGHTANDEL
jgi:hypothetical protein